MCSYSNEQDFSKNEDGKWLCLIDGKNFKLHRSLEVHLKNKYNMSYPSYLIKYDLDKKENYIECKICNNFCKNLKSHLQNHKDISFSEYENKYGKTKWICDSTSKKLSDLTKGENNPMSKTKTTEQKRKECSPFSIEFWKKKKPNITNEEAELKVKEIACKASNNRLTETQFEYWLEKCDGNITKAKILYKERQTTFSMGKCIEKHGEEEGAIIWKNRQDKWQKSLYENGNMKAGYSAISQDLFNIIKEYYLQKDLDNIYYATNNNEIILKYSNDKKNYLYDFVDINKMKIIEYNGDQFHANPNKYEENDIAHPYHKTNGLLAKDIWLKDKHKLDIAKLNGYDVLVIWDSEYRKGKDECIKKCLEFLGI
jgi:hypothetical protein